MFVNTPSSALLIISHLSAQHVRLIKRPSLTRRKLLSFSPRLLLPALMSTPDHHLHSVIYGFFFSFFFSGGRSEAPGPRRASEAGSLFLKHPGRPGHRGDTAGPNMARGVKSPGLMSRRGEADYSGGSEVMGPGPRRLLLISVSQIKAYEINSVSSSKVNRWDWDKPTSNACVFAVPEK